MSVAVIVPWAVFQQLAGQWDTIERSPRLEQGAAMQRLRVARAQPGGGGVVHDDAVPAGLQPRVCVGGLFLGPERAVASWQRGAGAVTARTLGALQVGALLISASYGTGLFGSGEYALRFGMAGAVYGVATGLGMIAMAAVAGRLWRAGRPVWDLLGGQCGERVRRLVALLSVVWMAGVLAAQIHGAVAIIRLLGVSAVPAHAAAIALIFAASRVELRAASVVFAGCLAAGAMVLLFALVTSGGVDLYVGSLPAFARALPSLGVAQTFTIAIGVGPLVCTGADYHQFVLAVRGPGAAICGCLLAGVGLLFLAFLPPAVVLSTIAQPGWPDIADPKQVVPQALSLAAKHLAVGAGPTMLGALGVAALGSGARCFAPWFQRCRQRSVAAYR